MKEFEPNAYQNKTEIYTIMNNFHECLSLNIEIQVWYSEIKIIRFSFFKITFVQNNKQIDVKFGWLTLPIFQSVQCSVIIPARSD